MRHETYVRETRIFVIGFGLPAWLFVAAVAIHNPEEAIWLPAWSKIAGPWHQPVDNAEFRFAELILTALAVAAAGLASVQGKGSLGAYLVAGYGLAMLLNVLISHVLATLWLGRYMPGTGTALQLNLPITLLLLRQAILEGFVDQWAFLIFGPAVVVGIVALIPLLFWMGRKWT